ncbi:MAG: histidine phosphatase family protein [Gemmatimonadaceae bacterium]
MMKLLVVRHAIAMDREEFAESGQADSLRPLTDKGIKRMQQGAKGLLTQLGNIDLLATSPLERALQTARIVADAYTVGDAEVTSCLSPGAPFEEFEQWCEAKGERDVIAIVGHEPHLSSLVTWLLAGHWESRLTLRKGGACLVGFESLPRRNAGVLEWLLKPRQLRML